MVIVMWRTMCWSGWKDRQRHDREEGEGKEREKKLNNKKWCDTNVGWWYDNLFILLSFNKMRLMTSTMLKYNKILYIYW